MNQKHTPPNPFWKPFKGLMRRLEDPLHKAKKILLSPDHKAALDQTTAKLEQSLNKSLASTKKMATVVSQQVAKEAKKAANTSKQTHRWLSPQLRNRLLMGLGVVFFAMIGWRLFFHGNPGGLPAGVDLATFDPRTTVEADVAQTQTITRKVKAVGTLKATDSALMKAEVPGVVAQVNFQDGAAVKKGDLLMTLDDSVPKAEYEARVSEYHQKKSAYARYEELFKRNIVPALEREKARAEAEVAGSQMHLSAAKLEQYKLIAPFDGLIGLRDVSVGSYVQAGQDLITVVKLNPMKVDFKVPEAYLQDLALGQEAVVSVDGFSKADFIAKIDAIDPKIDPASHSIQVRGSFENLDIKVRPGVFANVILTMGQKTDALMVPESAIDRSGQDEYVYVLRDIRGEKVAIRTIVTTGLRENGMVEILDGLSIGKEVVTAGQSKIRDGFQVRVVERLVPPSPVIDPLSAAGKMLSAPAANLVNAAGQMLAKPQGSGTPATPPAGDKPSAPEVKVESEAHTPLTPAPSITQGSAPEETKEPPVHTQDPAVAPLPPFPSIKPDSMSFPKPPRASPQQSILMRKPHGEKK